MSSVPPPSEPDVRISRIRLDEETFVRSFGRSDWPLMFILAQGGQTTARLRFHQPKVEAAHAALQRIEPTGGGLLHGIWTAETVIIGDFDGVVKAAN